uniref:Reverse transcriptase domain-containing protein n=1 Tax=Caenorhabditis japonica TaxID=281687 RepID=A0A8R1HRE5_CAEJA
MADDIIFWYIQKQIEISLDNKKFKVIDPLIWTTYRIYGVECVQNDLFGFEKYFFPICENGHWVLLIIDDKRVWYSDSLADKPIEVIEDLINKLNRTQGKFNQTVPKQKDGFNCGVHACLVAKSVITGNFWYTEKDVNDFRKTVKLWLFSEGFELYSEPYKQIQNKNISVNSEKNQISDNEENWGDKTQTVNESTLKERDEDIFLLRPHISVGVALKTEDEKNQKAEKLESPTKTSENTEEFQVDKNEKPESPNAQETPKNKPKMVPSPKNSEKEISTELLDAQEAGEELKSDPKAENPGNQSQKADSKKGKLNETERAAIPKLMAIKLKTPPKVEPVRRNPEKGENYQKGQPNKKRQIPTGKPDELVKKVREWFEIQFQAYFEDGKSFQRLEWITNLLTAAIHKASAGDEQAVGKIIKRCPPLEIEEGEMATQTETKQKPKNQKSTKGANSSSSIREAYAENRARTFNKIIGKDDKKCEIPIEKIEKFFENTTSNTNVPTKTLARITSDLPKLEIGSWIEEEFKEKEVAEALKKTKDTAPGVDGLRYHHLSWFDPKMNLLTKLYNECRIHKKIPSHWKEAETVLLYKGGDETQAENWRPISLMPTICKLYSSLWNKRIKSVTGVLSKCQRGFQEREGCNESIAILRTAIEAAKGTKKSLSIAWMDLTNAFGSVPHELIEATLIAYGFPGMVTEVIKDMYNGASIRVKTKNEKSKQILIKSGVKQGDPISPTLFNICLESVIRRYLKSADGHKCIGSNIKLLAFADDMAILSDSKTKLQQELQKMDDDCTPLNLIFKPAKCASLIIEWGKVQKDQKIKLKGQFIRSLAEQDTYKYLGVQTGIETRISAMHLMKKTVSELDKINCSELAPWQKLDAVKTFVLPRMTYMYANTVPKLSELKEFANITMRAIKVMQNIPVKGSPLEYVQLPIGKGGLGVACPKTTALITYLVSTMKKLWSTDDYIRKLHTDYLKMVAIKETKTKEVTLEDLASYLSDDKTVCKKAVGYNSFTRVREICRTLSKNKEALLSQLKIIENNGKLAILVQAVKDGKTKIFTNEHVNTLQKQLKKEINEALLHRFTTEKRVKSEVVRVVQEYPQCNSFVRDGGKVSIGAHRFVHKARLNLLACNYNTWQDAATKQCRRCGYEKETQWHILSSCPKSMGGKITERHDSVLKTVKEMIQTGSLKTGN